MFDLYYGVWRMLCEAIREGLPVTAPPGRPVAGLVCGACHKRPATRREPPVHRPDEIAAP